MKQMTQAAVERAMKLQDVMLQAMAKRIVRHRPSFSAPCRFRASKKAKKANRKAYDWPTDLGAPFHAQKQARSISS